ncbi:hypothetical protein [Corynebacterium flavescens]|uniref:hypothetical protein n=1 Tax=Corynebacterium flavescens TaxID=28028 RepID=UPI000EDC0F1B|nr:hypothetical protein [Corynebacterium flavescens]
MLWERVRSSMCVAPRTQLEVGGMIQIAETFYEAGLSDPKNNGMPLTPRPLVMQDGVLADFTEE